MQQPPQPLGYQQTNFQQTNTQLQAPPAPLGYGQTPQQFPIVPQTGYVQNPAFGVPLTMMPQQNQYQNQQIKTNMDYEESVRRFNELAQRNEICKDFVDRLRNLDGIEIVIIADDSGSMDSSIPPRPEKASSSRYTRWMELQDFINTSVDIVSTVDSDGCDVYFLNREPVLNVTKKEQLYATFSRSPSGCTPITSTYEKSIECKKTSYKRKRIIDYYCH